MKKESNSKIALCAMQRAAKKAIEKAAKMGLEIPIWKDGRIIFVDAKKKLEELSFS